MKLQIEADALRSVVTTAGLPVERSHSPILECIHISAKDNRISCFGYGRDRWVHAKSDAAVSDPGEISVNFKDILSVVRHLKGCVTLTDKDAGLHVEAERAAITIPSLYEAPPKAAKPQNEVEVEGGIKALQSAVPFCATDDVRVHLNGVGFDGEKAVAIDGKKLYVADAKGGKGQVVPQSAVSIIAKIGGRFFLGDQTWRVEAENVVATGQLIDAQCVEWQRLVSFGDVFATCDTDELIDAMEAATLGRAKYVVMECLPEGIRVSGDRFEGTQALGGFTITAEAQDALFVVDIEHLRKSLTTFKGCVINLSVSNAQNPAILIKPEGREDFCMVGILRDARTNMPSEKEAA